MPTIGTRFGTRGLSIGPHRGRSTTTAEFPAPTGRPGGRWGWVQCPTTRRRCQRNSVSGVTSHPARLGRASAAAIAPSKLRSASVSSGRSICRRSTASWWRNTMISRSFERPDLAPQPSQCNGPCRTRPGHQRPDPRLVQLLRTASRASDANNRYKIRYTRTQHRPASRQVNDHGRVSGTHRQFYCPPLGRSH